jgi:hypothetical protein
MPSLNVESSTRTFNERSMVVYSTMLRRVADGSTTVVYAGKVASRFYFRSTITVMNFACNSVFDLNPAWRLKFQWRLCLLCTQSSTVFD